MNSARFDEQVALVTGGASGLGMAISRRLAKEGATVVVFDLQAALFEELRADLGERVVFQSVDVTNEKAVAQAISEVVRVRGRLDVLVNSAGITGKTNVKSQDVDLEDFQKGAAGKSGRTVPDRQACASAHGAKGFGRILHIASIAGKDGNAGMLAYSASKAAVIGMTKVQARSTRRPESPSTRWPRPLSGHPWWTPCRKRR